MTDEEYELLVNCLEAGRRQLPDPPDAIDTSLGSGTLCEYLDAMKDTVIAMYEETEREPEEEMNHLLLHWAFTFGAGYSVMFERNVGRE